jgi:branched-chain amino acid transport system ATP-binding protein
VLSINSCICRYGRIEALHGVSLTIQAGEFVCLIGANGAGKTTLLRAISGLNRPVSGSITFNGVRIDNASPSAIVRAGIAHCPEERKVWPQLTVAEHLELGAFTCRDAHTIRTELDKIYGLFPRLAERRKQFAGTLSGGEQQMVAIGRALMSRPSLLLLDEPSLGLAPIIVESMSEIIGRIHKEGTAILLVEQNAFLALTLAQRGYVLETGNVAVEGPSKNLLADSYVKEAYLGGRKRPAQSTSA